MDTNKRTPEPRIVVVKKSQVDLGIQICGGNLYGIFVSDVDDDSPAKGPDGLVLGDMILEVSTSEMFCSVLTNGWDGIKREMPSAVCPTVCSVL